MTTPTRADFATVLSDWLVLDDAYSIRGVDLAISRGWNPLAHVDAVMAGDADRITLTHPFDFLTEDEVESIPVPSHR